MRRREPDQSSLELLLDTICNTFGGILFISILIVVIVNTTRPKIEDELPDDRSHQRLVEMQQQLEQSKNEIKMMQSLVDRQRRLVDDLGAGEVEKVLRQLLNREHEVQRLNSSKQEALSVVSSEQIEINNIAKNVKRVKETTRQSQEKVRKELDKVEELLRTEIARRTRSFKLPRLRMSTKDQVAYLLADGRLHRFQQAQADGGVRRAERESKVITDKDGVKRAVPIPGTGLTVDPKGANRIDVAQRFKFVDKSRHFVAIVVWPDSYEYFPVIKQTLVDRNIEYNLVLLPDDKGVPLNSAPSRGTQVM